MKLIKGGKVDKKFSRGETVLIPGNEAIESGDVNEAGEPLYEASLSLETWVVTGVETKNVCHCLEGCEDSPDCGPVDYYRLSKVGEPHRIKTLPSDFVFPESAEPSELGLKPCMTCRGWGEIKCVSIAAFKARLEGRPVEPKTRDCPWCHGGGFVERDEAKPIEAYEGVRKQTVKRMRKTEEGRKLRGPKAL